jgi:hypothetical protein
MSSSGKKPYFESDHFNGGGSVLEFFSRPVRGEIAPGVPIPNVWGSPRMRAVNSALQRLHSIQNMAVAILLLGLDPFPK